MTKIPNSRPKHDLEERTFQFAKAVRLFIKGLPKLIGNFPRSHAPRGNARRNVTTRSVVTR